MGIVDPAAAPGNFLGRSDFQALAVLDGGDELAGLEHGLVRPCIQPRVAPAHGLYGERAALQVQTVEVGDFQLAARRRFDLFGEFDHLRVIKIQAGHRVTGLGLGGFFLQADGLPVGIKLDYAVTLRVLHRVGEDGRPPLLLHGCFEGTGEVVAVKNVVTQHQRAGRAV